MRLLRSLAADVLFVLSTGYFAFLIWLVFLLRLPGAYETSTRIVRVWARLSLWSFGVKVRVFGAERIDPARPAIYMSNHQSHCDVLALAGYLPILPRYVAKQELARIPVFGPAMVSMGHITIDRSNRVDAIRSLEEAAAKIRGGTSVLMFPEGTRSADGLLGPFKKGGFMLALKAGVPIVPLSVRGGLGVLPRTTLLPRPGEMEIRVGEAIDPKRWTEETKEELMEAVRRGIAAGLP